MGRTQEARLREALDRAAAPGAQLTVVLVAILFAAACGRPLGAWFGPQDPDPDPSPSAPIWPYWGGGPGRTGQSPYVGPQHGDLRAIPLVPPVVEDEPELTHVLPGAIDAQGRVFAVGRDSDNSGWLFGVDADLEPFWAFRPSFGSISGLPALTADGTLVVEGRDEQLHGPMSEWFVPLVLAVNPRREEVWTFYPQQDALCSQYSSTSKPILAPDGTLFLALRSGPVENQLHALGPDGTAMWQWSRTAGWRTGTAIGPDGTLFATVAEASSSRIFALGPAGQTLWSTRAPSDRYPDPGLGLIALFAVDASGRVFAAGEGRLRAFSSAGLELWTVQLPEPTVTAGIAVGPDGTLYVGTQTAPSGEESVTGWLHAYTWTGRELWSLSLDTIPCGIPVVDAEGTIFLMGRAVDQGERSQILAISATGHVRFRKSFEDGHMPCGQGEDAWYVSSPMLDARGRLWLGSHSNRLLVVTR